MSPESTPPPIWDADRLRMATDAAGVALWAWDVDTDDIVMDERAHGMWGVAPGESSVTFEALSSRIHPEDLDRVRAAFTATRDILGAFEIDFRTVGGHDVRWISARGQSDDKAMFDRHMFGIFLDVTERKLARKTANCSPAR
jgi:PAS domain-containing protein